jgi:uncharacterized membrane protein
MNDFVLQLQGALHWLYVLPPLAGAIVCLTRLDVSKWAWILGGAFLMETVLSLFYRVTSSFNLYGSGGFAVVFLFTTVIGVLVQAVIVIGIVGLMTDLQAAADAKRSAARSRDLEAAGL